MITVFTYQNDFEPCTKGVVERSSTSMLILVRQFLKRHKLLLTIALLLLSTPSWSQNSGASATGSVVSNKIIQINGVLMTADSLRAVPYAVVQIRSKNRGVMASELGVFSIVAVKGDTLQFHSVGFRDKEYAIPSNLEGTQISLLQLMVQDTFYLPETIVRPMPSKEEFLYAFRNWNIPDDQYELARKNTDEMMMRALAQTLPRDGRELQSYYQSQQAQSAVYYGQVRPNNILNPLAWAEFMDAWKRGDYRRKR